ncbi:ETS-family transcription factor [Elysia marginata]|uniref:ETS-family transcription factor n=1 Tax=Elysia marginata TaxID=1093978 RepID=A0AAV4IQ37_9GAST|nr:ETS-family transcription factor [Elysia marginata]
MGVFNHRSLLSDLCFSSSAHSKTLAMKKFFVGDLSKDSLTSWTTKHPQNWTKKEVLDWVYYVVEQEKLDGSCVKGEAFSNFTGSCLIKMGREGFLAADPINGLKLYQTFRSLINNGQ